MKRLLLLLGVCFSLSFSDLYAQEGYLSHEQRTARLRELATKAGASSRLLSIGKSRGGKDLWALALTKGGEPEQKPALLIVAGLDGSHPAGTEIALRMAAQLIENQSADSIARLLASKTVYLLPCLNPDAMEQLNARLRYERTGNSFAFDEDRDGRLDEDPFEDLNNDGLITMVRVEDPTGTYVVSSLDDRLMVKADPTKGQAGQYLLLTEGTDNDKDGQFNEDGPGGVSPDKNFTFDYPAFTNGAGHYAASEPEVRALMDFLSLRPNIFAVLTFGPHNNLTEAPKYDANKTNKRIITGTLETDVKAMELVSGLYNNRVALKDLPPLPHTKGNFSQTAYFHAGRFSFSTPGWWAPKVEAPKDSTRKEAAPKAALKGKEPESDDLRFLQWAASQNLDVFVPWTSIQHPDFPGKKAEVGGIRPYAKINPPARFLDEPATHHVSFLTALGAHMPDVQIVNLRTEALGNNLHRLTLQVVNKGQLPTHAEIGDRVRWVQKVKTELTLAKGQTLVAGRKINLRGPLQPDQMEEYSWLISGNGRLSVVAGCATTGRKIVEVDLK